MLLEKDEVLDRLAASETPAGPTDPAPRAPGAAARVLPPSAPGAAHDRPEARPPADASLAAATEEAKPRPRTALQRLRSSGGFLTVAAGPVAGLMAWRMAGMGPVESLSLAFLVSVWIGPKLLNSDWS